MATTLLDKYETEKPVNAQANLRGGDPEPIGADNSFSPSKNLAKDEGRLRKARGGVLDTKPYTDRAINL
jgi:hypothetical protein